MKGYRVRYTTPEGMAGITDYKATMVQVHQACFDLAEQGIANKADMTIMDDRGTTYTVDAMEKVLAANDVTFPIIPDA